MQINKTDNPTFNRNILILRKKKNLSQDDFAKELGVKRSTISGYETGLSTPDVSTLLKIAKYFDVSLDFLVYGKYSDMLRGDSIIRPTGKGRDPINEIQSVPLYDLEASAGLVSLFKHDRINVLGTLSIPNMPKCDGAIYASGDSMYPLLKSGDIVCYKEWPIDKIFFGEMYVLSISINGDEEYVTIKYIQKSEIEGHILLVSQNANHQPKDIPLSSVTALAMVKVSIRINSML